jgi:hypothetical protein
MGYSTDFDGSFSLDRTLTPEHAAFLSAFADTRRMKRDGAKTGPDPIRDAAGLPANPDYFVSGRGLAGQDASILEYNQEPDGQPGLWCQWVPSETHDAIEWDGGEKFYEYEAWIVYLVEHFLGPWGYKLNGTVTWEGESQGDVGRLVMRDNVLSVERGRIVYDEEQAQS